MVQVSMDNLLEKNKNYQALLTLGVVAFILSTVPSKLEQNQLTGS